MKSIIFDLYRHGSAGVSNLIMSAELAVVVARLTDRVLILKGNRSPSANVVKYENLVSNNHRSRVTDLIDLGIPWIDADSVDLNAFAPHEICPGPTWERVFFYPPNLSTESDDFQSFAKRRSNFITVDDDLQNVPALSFSGGPKANTLCFYSYFFYLDQGAQLQAFDALRRMRPKPVLAAFAKQVADSLGAFNAAHIRRGDFKKTKGVTILERTPGEAIAALDMHFSRDKRLVILTDEAADPFFDEIKTTFRDHVFLDQYILDNYGKDFTNLPAHDSIALAYLSQLVGAESHDFVGSMKSTYTALVQRMRGNQGKVEPFKFLWNEMSSASDKRGRSTSSDGVRFENGVLSAENPGPYSWNNLGKLNPAWMREWPEGFLNEIAMAERASNRVAVLAEGSENSRARERSDSRDDEKTAISFLDSNVIASSNAPGAAGAIRDLFVTMRSSSDAPPLGEVRIETDGIRSRLLVNGRKFDEKKTRPIELLRALFREIVCRFIDRYPDLVWIHAGCAASGSGAILLPGVWGRGKSTLVMALYERGWSFLSDDIAPCDPATGKVNPFPVTPWVRANTGRTISRSRLGNIAKKSTPLDPARVAPGPQAISMIVFPHYSAGATPTLTPMSPGQAAGELLENCLSLTKNEDATIKQLCKMVGELPVYRLEFDAAAEATQLLVDTQASLTISTGDPGPEEDKEASHMDETEDIATVEVEVTLKGGINYASVLPTTSPILHDLYVSLAANHMPGSQRPAVMMQLPIDGGRAACSFMSDSLISLITRPPILVQSNLSQAAQGPGVSSAGAPPFTLIEDFLTPDENKQLLEYALENEEKFEASKTTTKKENYRKSKVLFSIKDSKWRDLFMARLKLHLPHITATLNTPGFRIGESEIQLTASNDGEFFKAHADAGNKGEPTAGREVTFVYYLHGSPKGYSGGDLLFYPDGPGNPDFDKGRGVKAITPKNNSLISFASNRWHEVDMVRCPSGKFADSRFTVNGWLRRAAE
jgi:SM-20-related protein